MEEDSKAHTTFATRSGLYECNVMSFDLVNHVNAHVVTIATGVNGETSSSSQIL